MANIDFRTREGRAMKAAAEAAKQAASAGQVLNESAPPADRSNDQDHRIEPLVEREEAPEIKRGNPARDDAMAEIEARDMKAKGITEQAVETPPAEQPKAAVSLNEPLTQAGDSVPPAPAVEAAAPVETVKVKVDGQEFDVPKADVEEAGGIKAYQKERAADNRLKKQSELLAETRRTQAQIANWIQSQQPPAAPVKTDTEFIQEKMDVIRFGTPEDSAAAMSEVLARGRPNIDQNQIVNQAITAMQQQAAENQFVQEFSDIVHNPLLLKLIIQEKNDRLARLTSVPDWSNFYRSIGNEVRGAIGRQSQPATPPATAGTTSQPDKEARKASIVNLPTAAARAALPEAEKPETREDILNEMRKSRGIPIG